MTEYELSCAGMNHYYQMPKPKYILKSSKSPSTSSFYKDQDSAGSRQKQIANVESAPVGMTQYIPLTNQDLIYSGNLHRCQSPDFQFIIRKIAKDLNLLLQFKYNDFWAELTASESLKKCLRSCLQVLPRKHFGQYVRKSKQQAEELNQPKLDKETLGIISILMRAVLFIYYRIICQSKPTEKDIVYDQWLLDIPKMLNLIGIYRHSNLKILKEIVQTALAEIPYYREDVVDFVRIMSTAMFNSLTMDFRYEYTQKIIMNSRNFNNPLLSFTRNLIKSFFRAFDVYVTMIDFINFFPSRYVMMLIGEPDLLLDYVDLYFQYMNNITGRWEFLPDFVNRFSPCIEVIRQKMIEFIMRAFDFIDFVLSEHTEHELWNNCLSVYYSVCKEFQCRNESPGNRWEQLIHIAISETPHRSIFRVESYFSTKLNKNQLAILQQCRKYEQQYRAELHRKNFHQEEIVELKLNQIKSFKDWNDFENFKSFDLMVENEFNLDFTLQQDSILLMLETEMHEAHYKKQHPHADPNNLHLLKRRRPKTYPFFEQQQYNDEPPLQEHEDSNFLLGMEPFEDLEDTEQFQLGDTDATVQSNRNNEQFLKRKKQFEDYQQYFTVAKEQSGDKKKNKHYIGKNELSIEYKSSQKKALKFEKMKQNPSGSPFKCKQDQIPQKSEKMQDNMELSISVVDQQEQSLSDLRELQNVIEDVRQSQLTVSKQASTVRQQDYLLRDNSQASGQSVQEELSLDYHKKESGKSKATQMQGKQKKSSKKQNQSRKPKKNNEQDMKKLNPFLYFDGAEMDLSISVIEHRQDKSIVSSCEDKMNDATKNEGSNPSNKTKAGPKNQRKGEFSKKLTFNQQW